MRAAILRAFAESLKLRHFVSSKMLYWRLTPTFFSTSSREVLEEFFRFYGYLSKIFSCALCKEGACLRMDSEAFFFVETLYPARKFVVPEEIGFQHLSRLEHCLVQGTALVCRCAVHQNHQHGAVKGLFTVDGKFLEGFHLLGFLEDYQLPFRHHGKTAGGGNDVFCRAVPAEHDRLVEVLFPVLQAVLLYGFCNEVGVIGFVPHEEINILEDAAADIFKYILGLTVNLYV